MKMWMTLGGVGTVIAVSAMLAVSAFAEPGAGGQQGQQGGPGQGMRPPMHMGMQRETMKAGANGVYLLLGNKLVKYTPAMQKAAEVTLGEQPAAAKGEGQQQPPRMVHGSFLVVTGRTDTVLAVVGDTFYRIDGATLAIEKTAALPAVTLPDGAPQTGARHRGHGGPGGMGRGQQGGPGGQQGCPGGQGGAMGQPGVPPMPPAMLELAGQTLYILRGPTLISVNIATAAVSGPAELPAPPQPPQPQQQ